MHANLNQTSTLRQQLSSIVGAVPFGIIVISHQKEIEIINARALEFLGLEDALPSNFVDESYQILKASIPEVVDKFEKLILSRKRRHFSHPCSSPLNDLELFITCKSMLHGTLLIIEDRTEKKALMHQNSHDHLTQVLNRQTFERRVDTVLQSSLESTKTSVVVFIDLDRFKLVNDLAGHSAGDEILKQVSTIILSCVRNRDSVARIGGDEFALLLEDCSLSKAQDIVHLILKKVEKINLVHLGRALSVSLSAGIAPIDKALYSDVSQLINAADAACRYAKGDNENRIHVMDSSKSEYALFMQDRNLLSILDEAIANDHFFLMFQRISPVNDSNNRCHYEALLRLQSEDGENIPPGLFIPVAERSKLMPKIDRWVIDRVFSQLTPNMHVAINLSGQSISDRKLGDFILSLAHKYIVKPEQITFEITETAAIENIEKTQEFIAMLRCEGYAFALDDFGTGLSSYQYLKNLPIDYIKIDGMFVKEIDEDEFSYAMIKSINSFAHTIGLKTIAEFVTSAPIHEKLKEIGVDFAQGFYLHKPQILEQIIKNTELDVPPEDNVVLELKGSVRCAPV